jgi:hypothetical protein
MKAFIVGAALFAAVSTNAYSLIGENESQIVARYGNSLGDIPTEAFGSVRGFMATGHVIGVAFVNGVSSMEMFSNNDQSDMSATQIDKFLKANGPGEWKVELTNNANWKRWRRADGALIAIYDTNRHFLYINSKTFYEAQGAKAEKLRQ